ncbi:MAG: hypothetical protein JXB00_20150 [Bacteroidales bacterium]|nr:hypothetical protein [Bacteroidales bacterium]
MKKFLLVVSTIFFIFSARAQEQLHHEKKVYVDPKGRTYINKALPIYLRLATSPDENSKSYLLKSEVTTKYSNPMYFDTEGYNTFRSPSQVDTVTKKVVYPLQDIIFEVYSDSKPPVTSIDYGSAKPYKKENKTFINGMVELTLKAKDETSGLENIYYSVDKAAFTIYNAPLKLDAEKEYIVKYYAVDNVGNVEPIHELVIVIDKSRPKTGYEVSGDLHENVLSARSKIIIKSNDNQGVGIENIFYRLNDNEEKKYTVPLQAAYLEQGEHKITFYAKDKVGNTEEPNVFSFYVDKTPPVIVQEILGKSFFAGGKEYSSGRSQLKLTTLDNKAGVKEVYYSLNNGEYKKYDRPFYLSNVTGNLTVKAYALDNVNNKTESVEMGDKTSLPYVDLTGPNVKHGFSGPLFVFRDTVYICGKTKIMLKAVDSESGLERIEYTVDNANTEIYSNEFSIGEQGLHKVNVTGYDNVENTSSSEFVVIVDNTGPEIYSRFSVSSVGNKVTDGKTIEQYPGHVVLFLSSSDQVVGFDQMFYSVNGAAEKKYAGLINYFPVKGDYNIVVRALDKLGNETRKSIEFSIAD